MTIIIDTEKRIITYDSLNAIEHILKITSQLKDINWWIIKKETAESVGDLKMLQSPLKF